MENVVLLGLLAAIAFSVIAFFTREKKQKKINLQLAMAISL